MALIALVLSLFVAALGALGMVSPMKLLGIARHFENPGGLCAAAALRIVLGVALFLAAPSSRAPEVVRVLGIIILVGGLITPLFGVERTRKLLDWWSARGRTFMRVWAGLALVFGLLLAYAVVP
jgi:hypothetical protein